MGSGHLRVQPSPTWWEAEEMRPGWPAVALLGLLPRIMLAQGLYQADLRIQTLKVQRVPEGLLAHAVVAVQATGNAAPSRGTNVQVLLPVGVGVLRISQGCVLGASPPGVTDLRGRVICEFGVVADRTTREITVLTTIPPLGVARTFGIVAISDTPDPKPSNNFAERTVP